jgi:hypothetical protein
MKKPKTPKPETPKEYYAAVRWAAEDVQGLRPDWTLERCEEELRSIESNLQDRLIELGHEVMDTLLPN